MTARRALGQPLGTVAALLVLITTQVAAGPQVPNGDLPCSTTTDASEPAPTPTTSSTTYDISSVSSVIGASSLQPFCASFLGSTLDWYATSETAYAATTVLTTYTIRTVTVTNSATTTPYTVTTTAQTTRPPTTLLKRADEPAASLTTPAALAGVPDGILWTACYDHVDEFTSATATITESRAETLTLDQTWTTDTSSIPAGTPVATVTASIEPIDCGLVAPLGGRPTDQQQPLNLIYGANGGDCPITWVYNQLGSANRLGVRSYAHGINVTSGLGICAFYFESARVEAAQVEGRLPEIPVATWFDLQCQRPDRK